MSTAAGSLFNESSFDNVKKIIVNTPHLTAFTALNGFSVADGHAVARAGFRFYSLQVDPPGVQRPWGWPFFEGNAVRDITVSLRTEGNDGTVEAVHILTLSQSLNVAPGAAQMSLESRPKKGVVVYDTATGTIKLAYEVINLSGSDLPDDRSIETEALDLAHKEIEQPFSAAVLQIDLDTMKRGTSYEVDLVSRTLKELKTSQR